MIVALDVESLHPLRRSAERVECADAGQPSTRRESNCISGNRDSVISRIGPGGLADEFKRALLKSPVYGKDTQRVVAGRGLIPIIPGPADFDAQHRAVRDASYDRSSIIDIETVVGQAFPLTGIFRAVELSDLRGTGGCIAARAGRDVDFIIQLAGSPRIERTVHARACFRYGAWDDQCADQRSIGQVVQRRIVQKVKLADG